ncbi:MAG TPA: ABC transporter ATP-binding protein [Tepidisphaeraceae bacterium]|jgi:lipopolysaccharide transport system ATP-binding protein|nr:ABC transporter ATP-binding protein [Tepidisphaeraceae bacterium]
MSDTAIKVDGLGKKYRLGGPSGNARYSYKSLRDVLAGAVTGSFRRNGHGKPPAEEFWALKDVSFEVTQGEVVGIIGRNGAGKSTLLKIISRITDPSAGQVEITGRVGSLLEVGTGFHPELTGRENIYLNGAILGMRRSEIDRKFAEIVAFAETEKFLDTPVKFYSSGMYMRLAFAVAAHLEPEILVVDEVLAVGDAAFQKKCMGKMSDVASQGRTVLFVSHNMNAIEELCGTVVMLDAGRARDSSKDVRAVIQRYLHGSGVGASAAEWRNPGKLFNFEEFHPSRFALTDAEGNPAIGIQRADAELWINIEADIRKLDPALTVGYAIYAESGETLYWSYQTDTGERSWPRLSLGQCVLRSKLPQRLLNEGTFRIELIGGLTQRAWFFEPGVSAPSISLTIQGGLSDSPLWMQRRPGLLSPVLPWTVSSAEHSGGILSN